MTIQYWLVKSEPDAYSWADFIRDGHADWTGVRNYAARNNLRAMLPADQVLFYESVTTKAIVGLAEVTRPAFPDPTTDDPAWVAVGLQPLRPLPRPVTLAQIKADPALADIALLRFNRLSVVPLKPAEFSQLQRLGGITPRPR